MRIRSVVFFALWCGLVSVASSQTVAMMDTTFGTKGKTEISFGKYGEELTDIYVSFNSYILAVGKVGTEDPGMTKIGLLQLDSTGAIDHKFGTSGMAVSSFGVSDYPNSVSVLSDSSIVIAGVSSKSTQLKDQLPALFRFKKSGVPDSSFGGDGHVAIGMDNLSGGSFKNVYQESTKFLACGASTEGDGGGRSGFCAMRFNSNGTLDSSFGIQGKALIPSNVTSVSGFLTTNASITFIGVALKTDSMPPIRLPIILARMTPNGMPDTTFGNKGILVTGVYLSDYTMKSAVQFDYKIVASIPPIFGAPEVPFNIIRFLPNGTPDSTYGSNSMMHIVMPGAAANVGGLEIAKNGKTVIAGSGSAGWQRAASARVNVDGTPDVTFNLTGSDIFDINSGGDSNYFVRFPAIGQKRYIGAGNSIHNGLSQFMIGRFHDVAPASVAETALDNTESIKLYPDPVAQVLTLSIPGGVHSVRIIDAFGREISSVNNPDVTLSTTELSLNVRNLPSGVYYCVGQKGSDRISSKFIVAH